MLFNSLQFIAFFPIVLAVYFCIPGRARQYWLLVASYYFYMCWNPKYVLLLLLSTVSTYAAGRLLYVWRDKPERKKLTVAGNLVLNFGILFVFKYFDFTWQTVSKVLQTAHVTMPENTLSLLLPVGISFYIFQAVGYTIDVYRGEIEPEKNFVRYALFVSFFPQLVAGPIERSGNLLPQVQNLADLNLWNSKRIQSGALTMLYGYVMKMIIADRAAIVADTVFDVEKYSEYAGFTVLIAAVLFAIQIYCDFAGYTFIAIGSAKIMGIELKNNFNAPYLATSFKDFWDRWHISLSTWFRDYLYFPLGGGRKGKIRKYINIMIVFCVSGLWHGAAWHYVVWGGLHGLCRVVGEITCKARDAFWKKLGVQIEVFSFRLLRGLLTFFSVSLIWVFFRAEAISQAVSLIRSIFTTWNPWVLFDGTLLTLGLDQKDWIVFRAALLLLIGVDICRKKNVSVTEHFEKQNLWFKWLVLLVGIAAVLLLGIYGADYRAAQFIYFQF